MINIAILGLGGIAVKMATTLGLMVDKGHQGLCPYAVAARDGARAEKFAKDYGFQKAYGSYEAMLSDPEVDLVYIATPHSHHHEHITLCLEHGKHVLCEKAFTVNAKQAQDVTALAQAKGLLLAEAIWTRYMPSRAIVEQLISSGAIGIPSILTANLAYPIDHIERIKQPELAGGALLDVGVYTLNFASMVFGDEIADIHSTVQMMPTGVDWQESITLTYKGGKMAILCASTSCAGDRHGMVYGSTGTLCVDNVNNPKIITITPANTSEGITHTLTMPDQLTGFEYEVQACLDAIAMRQTECPAMPHSEIIRIMQVMDQLRAQWGLRYPFE